MRMRIVAFLIVLTSMSIAVPVYAHPLDISITTLNILPAEKRIEATTYLHPFEGDYLLSTKLGLKLTSTREFFAHADDFFTYLKQRVVLKNNDEACTFEPGDMPVEDDIELVADGLRLEYVWKCNGTLDRLNVSNTLFIEDFPLQTNKIEIYKNGDYSKTIYQRVLTTKVTGDTYNLLSPPKGDPTKTRDTDSDGLSDYEEGLYLTDPAITDTDFDGYTDKEEVDNGWDARDPVPSPGETMRTPTDEARRMQTATTHTELTADTIATGSSGSALAVAGASSSGVTFATTTQVTAAAPINSDKPSGAFFFQNERLKRILQVIKSLLNSPGLASKLLVFFPVFLLGFLHSLESGHGKSVLVSYLVETERTMWDALKFSLTLALTDIAGVLVLGAGFELLFLSGSGYIYMSSVQTFGAWILLALGAFLVGRALFRYFQPWRELHEGAHHHTVALGFLAGLVPCTSGWALILTIISLNQVRWMIPIVLIFGLGIFVFLVVLSALILKFRNVLTKKMPRLVRISPILSGLLIMLVACVALGASYWR